MSCKALAKIVLGGLINVGLNIRNCRGQGYDGAAAVSGHINGLSAHICKINNKAIHAICHSHHLNLFIGASCYMLSMSLIKLKKFLIFASFLSSNKRC